MRFVFSPDIRCRCRYLFQCRVAPKKLADAPEKHTVAANDQKCTGSFEGVELTVDDDERRLRSTAYTTRYEDDIIDVHRTDNTESDSLPIM